MYLTGNKQEWAKIYALFKLITEQGIQKGDRSLEAEEKSFLPLIRLERIIPEGKLIIKTEKSDQLIFRPDVSEPNRIPTIRFKETATLLLSLIRGKEVSFECNEAEMLLEEMGIFDFYSASEEGEDIQAVFYDNTIDSEIFHKIRFRSLLDNLYLLSANRASNFKYDITQVKFSNPESNKINAIGDNETGSLLRLAEINRLGGKLKFTSTEGKFFWNALQLIDMQLPKLLAEMVRLFYTTDTITVKALTEEINRINPFKIKEEVISKGRFYEYKIRQFLYATACGMKPTKTWRGNGNNHLQLYINRKGDLLAYNPSEKEFFEKFLLANTRFSIPNEDKNKFGVIEKENGQWLIKLNLEIRFC